MVLGKPLQAKCLLYKRSLDESTWYQSKLSGVTLIKVLVKYYHRFRFFCLNPSNDTLQVELKKSFFKYYNSQPLSLIDCAVLIFYTFYFLTA